MKHLSEGRWLWMVMLLVGASLMGPSSVDARRRTGPAGGDDAWVRDLRSAVAAYESDGEGAIVPPSERQERLREWRSLSPERRRELRDRMNRLKRMDDADRRLYEQRFQQWRRLDPAERRQLLQKLDRWEMLSPEEQEAIRRRFRSP